MSTKNFSKMSTKKLNALLETASNEDKELIMNELNAREATKSEEPSPLTQGTTEYVSDEPLTDEEQAILDNLESKEVPTKQTTRPVSNKLTDEERHALAIELKEKNLNHRCQVVPFNSIEWVNGVIVGVVEEKRANSVLYAIKTEDGRRIMKAYNNNLLKVLDEVEERVATKAQRMAKAAERTPWTPEELDELIAKYLDNVGKVVEFNQFGTDERKSGRIVAIVPDKRVNSLLYRIVVATPTESEPNATKTIHKVVTSDSITIAAEFDEEGEAFNAKYCERRANAATRVNLTPAERVAKCEENVKKCEERLLKLTNELEERKAQLAAARDELAAYLAAQTNEPLA